MQLLGEFARNEREVACCISAFLGWQSSKAMELLGGMKFSLDSL